MGARAAGADRLHLTFASSPLSVRAAVRNMLAAPPLNLLDSEAMSTAEIVLVEVLNNIVEHAYGGTDGNISLTVLRSGADIDVTVVDEGKSLPGGNLPMGALPESTTLPEGGFGWFIIQSLCDGLAYRRDGPRNILTLRLPGQPKA